MAIICLSGVILILKPSFLFEQEEISDENISENDKYRVLGIILLIGSSITSAFNVVLIRKMSMSIDPIVLCTYAAFLGLPTTGILMIWNGTLSSISAMESIEMWKGSIVGSFGVLCMTKGYKFGEAGKVSLMGYS